MKRFRDIINSIDGYSPYDRLKRQVEALIAEVCFLEGVVIHLGAEEVLERHKNANKGEENETNNQQQFCC